MAWDDLCDECKRTFTIGKVGIAPFEHCHHGIILNKAKEEPKKKCWCDRYHYELDFAGKLRVEGHPIIYCIECGKRLVKELKE